MLFTIKLVSFLFRSKQMVEFRDTNDLDEIVGYFSTEPIMPGCMCACRTSNSTLVFETASTFPGAAKWLDCSGSNPRYSKTIHTGRGFKTKTSMCCIKTEINNSCLSAHTKKTIVRVDEMKEEFLHTIQVPTSFCGTFPAPSLKWNIQCFQLMSQQMDVVVCLCVMPTTIVCRCS